MWLVVLAVATALLVACSTEPSATREAPPPGPVPTTNVLVFLVDDMDDFTCRETSTFLPRSAPWLRDQGRCFENASVTDPVCCPSRSVFMTAQMPHNNGVRRQIDAHKLQVEDTLQHTLGRAGMRTYGTGKMLNGINAFDYESGKVDSGFESSDFWQGMRYHGYKLWDDEQGRAVMPPDRVNATVRTGDFGSAFVSEVTRTGDPFYAYIGFKAPHTDNRPGSEGRKFPTPTAANARRRVPPLEWNPEDRTDDKLPLFQNPAHKRDYFERLHAARVRSVYDVDDQMARIMTQLQAAGVLDRTMVIFTSDNGYHLGQNGWETKGVPYRPSIDVPLLIRYPAVFGSQVVDGRNVGLIDLAPTIYDVLGLTPDHLMDGHSLASTAARRRGSFYEYSAEKNALVTKEDGGVGVVSPALVPSWAMYRWGKKSYIEFYRKDGSVLAREFYADRDQQRNLLHPSSSWNVDRGTVAKFKRLLDAARKCAGTRESGSARPCP